MKSGREIRTLFHRWLESIQYCCFVFTDISYYCFQPGFLFVWRYKLGSVGAQRTKLLHWCVNVSEGLLEEVVNWADFLIKWACVCFIYNSGQTAKYLMSWLGIMLKDTFLYICLITVARNTILVSQFPFT
jgi:hypothetical protein